MPAITISDKTTYITEPLMADGTPDYVAFLNARHGAGVTAENNGAVLIAPALGMKVEDDIFESMGVDPEIARSRPRLMGDVLWDRFDAYLKWSDKDVAKRSSCDRRAIYDAFLEEGLRNEEKGPCAAEDCPATVAWIEANDGALSAIQEATRRHRYFIPRAEGENLAFQPVPGLLGQRTAAQAFRARAMLALGRGAWDAAADEVLTGYRLSALTSQGGTAIDKLIAMAQRDLASEALTRLASSPDFDLEAARSLVAELRNVDAISFDFTTERVHALAGVFWLWQAGDPENWKELLEPGGDEFDHIPDALYRVPSHVVDWDEALRIVNRAWERAEANGHEEGEAWKLNLEEPALTELLDRVAHDPEARLELTRAVVSGAGALPQLARMRVSLDESRAKSRLAIASLASAVFRAENGRWPARFDDLPDPSPVASGYDFRLHVVDADRIAIVASPQKRYVTGRYGYCWDGTDDGMLVTSDGSTPEILGGRCHWPRSSKAKASAGPGSAPWVLAGVAGLLLTTLLIFASRQIDAPGVLVCATALGASLVWAGARVADFYTFASPRLPEVNAEIVRAKTVAARLPEFRRDVERQEETLWAITQLLPSSFETDSFEPTIREWAAEPGFTVEGTWLDKDWTPHQRARLTVCLADDKDAAERLREHRNALPEAVRFIEGKGTEAGAEVVVEWFALPRKKSRKRRTEELCERADKMFPFIVTRELRGACAEWNRLSPVIVQFTEYDEDRRDLERRERMLEKLRESP